MRTLLLALSIMMVLAPPLSAAPPLTAETSATLKTLSTLSGQKFDIAFMQTMVPLDEEAAEIALAATLNADHAELLQWNQRLVERKNEQVRQMLAWLKESGAAPTRRGVGLLTPAVKKMRSLKDAALEKAYLPLMATHLEQTTALASLAAKKASDPKVRAFAVVVVRIETQEAAMLRGWMKKWYGR